MHKQHFAPLLHCLNQHKSIVFCKALLKNYLHKNSGLPLPPVGLSQINDCGLFKKTGASLTGRLIVRKQEVNSLVSKHKPKLGYNFSTKMNTSAGGKYFGKFHNSSCRCAGIRVYVFVKLL